MWVASGDQIGDVFSCDASNVNRDVVLRAKVRHSDVTAVSIVAVGSDVRAVGREIDLAVIASRSDRFNLFPLAIEPGHQQAVQVKPPTVTT
jgi:hypothetical protein